MIDQLIIGNKASYDDFEASVRERHISDPKKKSIKDTVPFSNKTYDFSAINGELYWEERELEYVFEISALTPEELENKKIVFKSWIMNVMNECIYDPFITDYHFIGTYEDSEPDDSEIEKSTITVIFKAYPYMVSNRIKQYSYDVVKDESRIVTIFNNSSHRITPTFISDVPITLIKDNVSFSIPAGETTSDKVMFSIGANTLSFETTGESGTFTIEFYEEVF